MPGINEGGRPSTLPAEDTAMTRVIPCLRRICVDYANILLPNTQLDALSLSFLDLKNIGLSILLIPPRRYCATAFVDVFIEFMD